MKFDSSKPFPRFIANILLLVCAVVVTSILAEGFLRSFYPQKLSLNVSQWDPYVGFSNIPGLEGYSETSDYVMHVSINSHGLRDREISYAKPPHTFRIGIFGDSFTFGEGVQNSEAYPGVLQQLLNRDRSSSQDQIEAVEVLNFGIGKTGTSQQLAFYQREGTKYQLDLVVLGFLAGNDFDDNWGGVFYLEDDTLVHNATAYSTIRKMQGFLFGLPFYRWAATHSHLVNLFRKAATLVDDRARTRTAALVNEPRGAGSADANIAKVHLTARLVEEFDHEARLRGSDFLVVNLPKKGQRATSQYGPKEPSPLYVVNCDMLLRSLHEKRIQILDLVPVFSKLPVMTHYFVHDGHMTTLGHQTIAHNLHQYLLENRLVPHRPIASVLIMTAHGNVAHSELPRVNSGHMLDEHPRTIAAIP
jgi:hypothetical protein